VTGNMITLKTSEYPNSLVGVTIPSRGHGHISKEEEDEDQEEDRPMEVGGHHVLYKGRAIVNISGVATEDSLLFPSNKNDGKATCSDNTTDNRILGRVLKPLSNGKVIALVDLKIDQRESMDKYLNM
jgi:hypothetical protein